MALVGTCPVCAGPIRDRDAAEIIAFDLTPDLITLDRSEGPVPIGRPTAMAHARCMYDDPRRTPPELAEAAAAADHRDACPECEAPRGDAETVLVYTCAGGCDPTTDEPESPLYECGQCGTSFNRDGSADGAGSRCPDCNRFAARVADLACADCGEAEATEADGWVCGACGTVAEVGS